MYYMVTAMTKVVRRSEISYIDGNDESKYKVLMLKVTIMQFHRGLAAKPRFAFQL